MIWWIFEWIWYLHMVIMIYWNGIVPDALDEFPGPIKVIFPVRNINPEMYNETLFANFPMGPNAFNETYWMDMGDMMDMGMNDTMNMSMMTGPEMQMMDNMGMMGMMKPEMNDWDFVEAGFGNSLTPYETFNMPRVSWEADRRGRDFYTLVEVDLDVSTGGQFLHWMVVNIPGSDLSRGEIKMPYASSAPPMGTGEHRYVWVVYRQMMGRQDFDMFPTSPMNPLACFGNRFGFELGEFVQMFNLEAHGTNFMKVEYGPFVEATSSLFAMVAPTLPQNATVCAKPLPVFPMPDMMSPMMPEMPESPDMPAPVPPPANKLSLRARG